MTTAKDYDNRDSAEMYTYFEGRIEIMKRRIDELESENRQLRVELELEKSLKILLAQQMDKGTDYNANLGAVEKG